MTTTIYGASDDLIEIRGDIEEEFGCYDDEGGVLAFSNGVLLSARYDDDGVWRFDPIRGAGHVSIAKGVPDDDDNYTDRVTITDPIEWVVYGTQHARTKPRRG